MVVTMDRQLMESFMNTMVHDMSIADTNTEASDDWSYDSNSSNDEDDKDDDDDDDDDSCDSNVTDSSDTWMEGMDQLQHFHQQHRNTNTNTNTNNTIKTLNFFPSSVSSPAIVAMNLALVNNSNKPLIAKEQLEREHALRSESVTKFTPMDGAPPSLMERMKNAESFMGSSNQTIHMEYQKLSQSQSIYKVLAIPSAIESQQPSAYRPKGPISADEPAASTTVPATVDTRDPQDHFMDLLRSKGIHAKTVPALDLQGGFFLTMNDDNINGYDMAKAAALRTDDIEALRKMHQQGQNLQVCNRFGESILHAACRRGATDMMKFFVHEAGVSIRVIDDYGRTVMHDACWTTKPMFELMEFLLDCCPDLLLVADKRGCTPLQYVRKQAWGEWCQFLEQRHEKLIPRELNQKGESSCNTILR